MQYMVYVKMVNSQGLELSANSKRELALAFSFVFANLFRYMPPYGLVRSLFSEVIVSKGSFPIFGIGLWTAYSVEKMFINNTQKVLFKNNIISFILEKDTLRLTIHMQPECH